MCAHGISLLTWRVLFITWCTWRAPRLPYYRISVSTFCLFLGKHPPPLHRWNIDEETSTPFSAYISQFLLGIALDRRIRDFNYPPLSLSLPIFMLTFDWLYIYNVARKITRWRKERNLSLRILKTFKLEKQQSPYIEGIPAGNRVHLRVHRSRH